MLKSILFLVTAILSTFRTRQALALENLLLRQQLIVLQSKHKRPRFQNSDRVMLAWISRIYPQWKEALLIVKPETVIRWHKLGFKLFWRWKSRLRNAGRNKIDPEIRNLIRSMSQANILWGAPRIHGELLKLGIEISQAIVRRYMANEADHLKPGAPSSITTPKTWCQWTSSWFPQSPSSSYLSLSYYPTTVGKSSISMSHPHQPPSGRGNRLSRHSLGTRLRNTCFETMTRSMALSSQRGSMPLGSRR